MNAPIYASDFVAPFYYSTTNSYPRYALAFSSLRCSRAAFFLIFFSLRHSIRYTRYTRRSLSLSRIRGSYRRDVPGFSPLSAGDSRRNRRREGKSTLAMYRLGIMAVGTFRALFQPLEGSSSFVSPR